MPLSVTTHPEHPRPGRVQPLHLAGCMGRVDTVKGSAQGHGLGNVTFRSPRRTPVKSLMQRPLGGRDWRLFRDTGFLRS